MRLVLSQKIFAFGDDFTIRDEEGRILYQVDGKVFSIGDSLAIRDAEGNDVARISERVLSWGPTYEIEIGGRHVATMSKRLFTLLRTKFEIDLPNAPDLEAQGNFLDYEYTFTRDGRNVAIVSKQWFRMRDTYGIDVAVGEDALFFVCCAVVIDLVCHRKGGD